MVKAKKKQIAYCGTVCSECGAYIATQNDDNKKRKEVAEKWSKEYGHEIKPEDINCTGCTPAAGKKLGYCAVCEVRICGREKKVVNCAYCDDYICKTLGNFFKRAPMLKTNLDAIRKGVAR